MKQTAVEWLLENLISEPHSEEDFNYNSECWDRAKEMEKEQINDACYEGYYQEGMYDTRAYYDKKYKQQEQ